MRGKRPFLHLASGSSAADGVRQALRRLGRAEEVIGFVDGVSEGPLRDVDAGAVSRAAWWNRGPGEKLSASDARAFDDATVWNRVRADARDVVIWHGPHPAAPLLYARVDAIPTGDEPVAMELELIDPSLFLGYDADAPSRFADAIIGACLHGERATS